MSVFAVHRVSPLELETHYVEAAPQKDCLCGAFWGALALRTAGITSFGGESIDQDLLATECGLTLDDGDPYESLPPGASPRTDYRVQLPFAEDRRRAGTAAHSLRSAVERCSEGALAAVPVLGPWTEQSVIRLFQLVERSTTSCLLIANYRTSFLWGTRPSPAALLAYLAGADPAGPPPEWNVGHYVALQFVVVNGERALVGILDTYPSLGWHGHHLQPGHAVAQALARPDEPSQGGVLCVVPTAQEPRLGAALAEEGFGVGDWDNGSDGSGRPVRP